jgi:hypothetical protein
MNKIWNKNENLREFLEGEWEQVGIGILDGHPVETESYSERMAIKDSKTMSIEHNCFGEWDTVEMGLMVDGNEVTMTQEVVARGQREGNTYNLKGILDDGREVRFKLFALGDKFIQHREIWEKGSVVQIDFSYLTRKTHS